MRMSLRLIFSLVVGVTLVSFLFAVFQVKAEKRGLQKELENRAAMVGESLEGKVEPLLNPRSHKRLQAVVADSGSSEHLKGIAIFNKSGDSLAMTPGLEDYLRVVLPQVIQVIASKERYASFTTVNGKLTHIYILPLRDEAEVPGALALFHDASFIKAQTSRLWWDTFLSVLAQAVFIALVTLLIIRWSIVGPMARATKWIREIRAGKRTGRSGLRRGPFQTLGAGGDAPGQRAWRSPGPRRRRKRGFAKPPNHCGRRNACACTCGASWGTGRSLWFPIANLTRTFTGEKTWKSPFRQAVWLRRLNPSCGPARARGSRTAPGMPIAKPWTNGTACACLPMNLNTR